LAHSPDDITAFIIFLSIFISFCIPFLRPLCLCTAVYAVDIASLSKSRKSGYRTTGLSTGHFDVKSRYAAATAAAFMSFLSRANFRIQKFPGLYTSVIKRAEVNAVATSVLLSLLAVVRTWDTSVCMAVGIFRC